MDGLTNNIFVFIVCGTSEHIDTLHYSLKYLTHFSKNRIVVLTDSSRNEIAINHTDIIDIQTPPAYDHHQASIYLKTGVYKFLPKGNNYCYLDTDVLALDPEVDLIFNDFLPPIRFAKDHSPMDVFSPHAINCSCLAIFNQRSDELQTLIKKYDPNLEIRKRYSKEQDKLLHLLNTEKSFLNKTLQSIRYKLSPSIFKLDNYYLDKQKGVWFLPANNEAILYNFQVIKKDIEDNSEFIWKEEEKRWYWQGKLKLDIPKCSHLQEQIETSFKISVRNSHWNHWNGGVFLFNDESHQFLESWHQKTLAIFELDEWKTRDQGTLIATVWEWGLENHPYLDKQWNFIANYYNEQLHLKGINTFSDDNWETEHNVALIHVFHHFGDPTWPIWNQVNKILPHD